MRLSDFNSVFQVSVALHLGYAFLSDLHEYHLRKLEDLADSAARAAEFQSKSSNVDSLIFWVDHMRSLINDRRRDLGWTTLWMQTSSIGIAAFSLAILIVSGVSPNLLLDGWVVLLLLAIAILPMPLFCLWSYVSHRRWRKSIKATEGGLRRAWTAVIAPILTELDKVSEATKEGQD
jgi:hypothetical protein